MINSLFSHNNAIGYGANPQRSGTPGSGGAIYNDGNTFVLDIVGTVIKSHDEGGAVFFVSRPFRSPDHPGIQSCAAIPANH